MPLTEDVPVRRRRSSQDETSRMRRAQILDAAAVAFSERGFNATSLREVAARVGISHTGLMHHYPDKNALLEALLDDRLRGAAETYPLDARDGATFFRSLVALAERDAQRPDHLRLITVLAAEALNPEHPAHGYFIQWYAEVRALLTTALLDLDARGAYRGSLPPAQAALHLSVMREGAHLSWLLDPTTFDLPAVVREQLELFVSIDLNT